MVASFDAELGTAPFDSYDWEALDIEGPEDDELDCAATVCEINSDDEGSVKSIDLGSVRAKRGGFKAFVLDKRGDGGPSAEGKKRKRARGKKQETKEGARCP